MVDFNSPLNCPQIVENRVERDGIGYGSSKDVAVDVARREADTRIQLHVEWVKCAGDKCRKKVDADPPYDKQEPEYSEEGSGWRCFVVRVRRVEITCYKPTPVENSTAQSKE